VVFWFIQVILSVFSVLGVSPSQPSAILHDSSSFSLPHQSPYCATVSVFGVLPVLPGPSHRTTTSYRTLPLPTAPAPQYLILDGSPTGRPFHRLNHPMVDRFLLSPTRFAYAPFPSSSSITYPRPPFGRDAYHVSRCWAYTGAVM